MVEDTTVDDDVDTVALVTLDAAADEGFAFELAVRMAVTTDDELALLRAEVIDEICDDLRVEVDPAIVTVTTTAVDAVYVGAAVGSAEGAAEGAAVG